MSKLDFSKLVITADETYHDWARSGGPNECKHGYASSIPCPQCAVEAAQTILRAASESGMSVDEIVLLLKGNVRAQIWDIFQILHSVSDTDAINDHPAYVRAYQQLAQLYRKLKPELQQFIKNDLTPQGGKAEVPSEQG